LSTYFVSILDVALLVWNQHHGKAANDKKAQQKKNNNRVGVQISTTGQSIGFNSPLIAVDSQSSLSRGSR